MNIQEILQFHIDVFRPETIPMSRLAQYMAALATLYGNDAFVHFDKMRMGSAVLQTKVDARAIQDVERRLQRVCEADAPDDICKAFAEINNLLQIDKAVGKIKREKGAAILKFSGKQSIVEKTYKVREAGVLDGVVIRIGGKGNTIPVWLEDQAGNIAHCDASRDMARELVRYYLGLPIRVTGQGDWLRDSDGQWKLDKFKITAWCVVDETPIEEIIRIARAAPGNGWNAIDEPIKEHLIIRGAA